MAVNALSPAAIFDPASPGTNLARSSNAASATAPAPTAAGNALKKLSGDFDSFLTLLTSQLQNQDPLKPMDSSEFTSQLVQFSSVEQEIQSNKNLETMIALMGGNNATAAFNYIGREVTISGGQTNLANGEAKWTYEVDPSAVSSDISITDAKGKVVFNTTGETGAGAHTFIWDGKNKNGDPLLEGVYTLKVSALNLDKKTVNSVVTSSGIVTGVDTSGTVPLLEIGNVKVGLENIVGVTAPTTAGNGSLINYIGKEITASTPEQRLLNSEASWSYRVNPSTVSNTLSIVDSKGKTVFTADGEVQSGVYIFTWDGKNQTGEQLADGLYTLKLKTLGRDDKPVSSSVIFQGVVSGIEAVGTSSALVVGDVKIRLEDVLSVQPNNTRTASNAAGGT
jgi:flagellar basal-body rod modification protein FlgD